MTQTVATPAQKPPTSPLRSTTRRSPVCTLSVLVSMGQRYGSPRSAQPGAGPSPVGAARGKTVPMPGETRELHPSVAMRLGTCPRPAGSLLLPSRSGERDARTLSDVAAHGTDASRAHR